MYFDQAAHLPLSISAIHQLQARTEGWAAGLVLAAISLREEVQPEDLISHLSGSDRQVSDYLLDQVFNNQPDEIQEFLLKTATFNQFCAPLLCEVFGFEQSEREIQALLERIEAAQLFLIPWIRSALSTAITTCSTRCCSRDSVFTSLPTRSSCFTGARLPG